MRRFKSTPQKKFIGMAILFVLIPLFILLYGLFAIKWRPSPDTMIIAAAIAALLYYFYRRYKKQLAAQLAPASGGRGVDEGAAGEPVAGELYGGEPEAAEEVTAPPAKKQK